ncbi:MAG: hypothetical protein B7Z55_19650, partial [Planctomycetales bacterium 12-60-4]
MLLGERGGNFTLQFAGALQIRCRGIGPFFRLFRSRRSPTGDIEFFGGLSQFRFDRRERCVRQLAHLLCQLLQLRLGLGVGELIRGKLAANLLGSP